MAYAFLCLFFGCKYRFSSDFAIIYLVCLPGNMGREKGESLKRYPAYKRDWLVILMLNNFNKKQRATTLL
ncbi:hypothetical protein ACO1ZI_17715, partial [Klebsiella pneumoniae]|uniref:hypothetical protein n=1 Tax=Klebsiella pneumoniae TaxID=573 RepID=UPI003BF64B6E